MRRKAIAIASLVALAPLATHADVPTPFATFAARFVALAEDRDVYVYFKHEDEPSGAQNGVALLSEALVQARAGLR